LFLVVEPLSLLALEGIKVGFADSLLGAVEAQQQSRVSGVGHDELRLPVKKR
jgi:hypothetical protein